jgi:purine-binding chemotaxis protein CheW
VAQFSSLFQLKRERAKPEEERLFLGFTAGDQAYATDVAAVREILRIPRIYTLPKVPSFVKGVIDLRGVVMPVLDLKERLGMGPVDLKKGRVIVVVPGNKPLGILVDTVVEVFRTSPKAILPPPEMLEEGQLGFIEGMVRVDAHLYLVLNSRTMLTPREFKTIESRTWSS